MDKKVLVATVGMSDPIRSFSDGPNLHIIRHYHPAVVYLLCTSEVYAIEDTKHINQDAIHMLAPDCEVSVVDMGIKDAHSYDSISKKISKICADIRMHHPEQQIFLNISSGTQQMNTIFCLLAMSEPEIYTAIQVSAPQNGANRSEQFNPDKDDLSAWFETDFDNSEDAINRCLVPKLLNFRKPVTQMQIESLIENYDYAGAYMLYQMNSSLFTEESGMLLLHAKKRVNLEAKEAEGLARKLGMLEKLYLVKRSNISRLIEFFHSMDIKQKRGELNDMVLRLEIMTEYTAIYLMECGIKVKIEEITDNRRRKNSIIRYTNPVLFEKKMKGITNYLDSQFATQFNWGQPINSRTIVYILRFYAEQKNDRKFLECVMEMEKWLDVVAEVRNSAAHSIMAVTEEEIKDTYGNASAILMKSIRTILKKIFGAEAPIEAFDIYNDINRYICENLQNE